MILASALSLRGQHESIASEGAPMRSNARSGDRILGSLRSKDGRGIARMEDRFDASIEDLWSALTDPGRLAAWYGEVEGDLQVGGEFHVRHAGGEREGHIDVCEPLQHLRVTLRDPDAKPGQPEQVVMEIELTATDGQTILVVEAHGLPLPLLAAYGVGVQIHVENLADHILGRESGDEEERWEKLFPPYEALSAQVR
jgi:uncharacterized protein YndB with AHSA1/START domain